MLHTLTHCPMGQVEVILQVHITNSFYKLISWALTVKLVLGECRWAPLIISQHWFRWWLGAIRQQAITWADIDPELCHHMVSLGHNELTHLLVPHICVGGYGQHWFRQWLVAYSVPSHYLNQCWVIINWTLRNKLQLNFDQNKKLFIHENASENIICEMAAMLSRRRRVNSLRLGDAIWHHESSLTLAPVMTYCLTALNHHLLPQQEHISMILLFKIEARFTGKEFQGNGFQNAFYKVMAILLISQSVIDETPKVWSQGTPLKSWWTVIVTD